MPVLLSFLIHALIAAGVLVTAQTAPPKGSPPSAPETVEVTFLPKPRETQAPETQDEPDPFGIILKQAPHLNDKCEHWYGGVGLMHARDAEGNVMIVEVAYGYPAWNAGVRTGDFLVSNLGTLRGIPGTPVTIDIVRQGFPMSFQTFRDKICTNDP